MPSSLKHTSKTKKRKVWQHPLDRKIRVSQQTAVTVAILEMGVSNQTEIAAAAALPLEEVRRIAQSPDPTLAKLRARGIPYGIYFRLHDKVRCPKCDGWITIAPCVLCDRRQKPTSK